MKRFRKWLILAAVAAVCAAGIWLLLQVTAEYPELGEEMTEPVNDIPGFTLELREIRHTFNKGYTLKWAIDANRDATYTMNANPSNAPERLERQVDGRWYRLVRKGTWADYDLPFDLGGEEGSLGLQASLVQKYNGYGTRLEPGLYRLTVELLAPDGTPRYLAAEFTAE